MDHERSGLITLMAPRAPSGRGSRKNVRLKTALRAASESAEKIRALDEEISVDPSVSQLREIIKTASRREPTVDELLKGLGPFPKAMVMMTRSFSEAMRIIIKG
jgi:hypothetical protein